MFSLSTLGLWHKNLSSNNGNPASPKASTGKPRDRDLAIQDKIVYLNVRWEPDLCLSYLQWVSKGYPRQITIPLKKEIVPCAEKSKHTPQIEKKKPLGVEKNTVWYTCHKLPRGGSFWIATWEFTKEITAIILLPCDHTITWHKLGLNEWKRTIESAFETNFLCCFNKGIFVDSLSK